MLNLAWLDRDLNSHEPRTLIITSCGSVWFVTIYRNQITSRSVQSNQILSSKHCLPGNHKETFKKMENMPTWIELVIAGMDPGYWQSRLKKKW